MLLLTKKQKATHPLPWQAKYDVLLEESFNGDTSFHSAVNTAFENFVNLYPRSPEFLSLFIDQQLRKGLRGVSEDEVEATLDRAMVLFRFLQEKDVFERYYKKHLQRRLLLGRSVGDDAERNMIQKLKLECGYQFTSKLEGMFTDMALSSDTMEGFRSFLGSSAKRRLQGIDFSVHILTTGFWPTQTAVSCTLPPEIVKCCEVFKKYYLSQHSGRRLTWQTNMGTAEMTARFRNKHELIVTTHQMCILLLFNEADSLTVADLAEQTAIPDSDLKRAVGALCLGKAKVLKKAPKGKTMAPDDVLTFNRKFSSKLFRVKLMSVAKVDTAEQLDGTREKVNEDRKHQIEAAIVRIMKARKTLSHANLIAEVTEQLSSRFMPNPLFIKKRIESLIEREYLERDERNRRQYNYLA